MKNVPTFIEQLLYKKQLWMQDIGKIYKHSINLVYGGSPLRRKKSVSPFRQ